MSLLWTILIASVVINYFLGGAYIKLLKDYNDIKSMKEDLEKLYGSIDKLSAKHKKLRERNK